LPQRFRLVQRAAEQTAKKLVADNISQNEFYSVLLPYLSLLFDRGGGSAATTTTSNEHPTKAVGTSGDGEGDEAAASSSVLRREDSIVHFSAVEALEARRGAQQALHRLPSDVISVGGIRPLPTLRRDHNHGHSSVPAAAKLHIDVGGDDAYDTSRRRVPSQAVENVVLEAGGGGRLAKLVRAAMQRQEGDLVSILSSDASGAPSLGRDDSMGTSARVAMAQSQRLVERWGPPRMMRPRRDSAVAPGGAALP
jgi:hypothetical protein